MKYVANGIYSSYMPLKRITRKIEQIIREEMDAIDGQEVQFPVVMPAALWQESGRYESIGSELVRFTDRNKSPLVLGMTHEEAAVQLVREFGQSHSKYPFMIYQIQTKFRDEGRPRGGLIRVREFTMKDAYSFHTSEQDLEQYYDRCFHAYERIYHRSGIPEVISVASDSGMMGGNISHEFMFLTPIGEDSIVLCKSCGYKANMEAAKSVIHNEKEPNSNTLTLVHTPDTHTIEEVCSFLGVAKEKTCKAVVYQKNENDDYMVLFIRGDLDVNETKLTNHLGFAIHPAIITDECGLNAGYIGPYQLDIERDIGNVEYFDFAKIVEGGICPECGCATLSISRGVEVGNIFQLGTKYTTSMNMTYLDKDGNTNYPIMGCYGIGVGRLAASICEAHHDEYGPIWPISVAPWQVHICAVRADDANVKECADKLYADLLGIPLRIIVSPRNIKENCCEIVSRDKKISSQVPLDLALVKVLGLIDNLRLV